MKNFPYQVPAGILAGDILAGDLLDGAKAISTHLFNDPAQRRRIYYLVEQRGLPVFRVGSRIMARRSTLAKWIAAQECLGGVA